MLYNSIVARSFSKQEQKRFRYAALIGCLLIALSFCTVLKPYLGPTTVLNLQVPVGVGLKMLMVKNATSFQRLFKDNSSCQHILDDIRKSGQAVDNISSSQNIVTNTTNQKLIGTNSSQNIVNDTNNSAEIVEGKLAGVRLLITAIMPALLTGVVLMLFSEVPDLVQKKVEPPIVCNITKQSDFCQINDNTRIEASSATVYLASSQADGISVENSSWIVRPYARKVDNWLMSHLVREWSVKSVVGSQELPKCTQNHSVPAILFSAGGYTYNYFHSFTDVLIPLYLTSRQFDGEVVFVITDQRPLWIEKFGEFLQKLSKYDIIDIDKQTNDVHCFPGGIIGLKRLDSKELNLDPSTSSYSMKDFRQFLRSTYSLPKSTAIRKTNEGETKRPQLLIISRNKTRSFINPGKIVQMATRLGYKVVVAEADVDVPRFAKIVNFCDVLVGVHGAGLTNIVFLPDNAVFIQIVPIGVEWLAKADFGLPSKAMNLRYLKYAIEPNESSLIQQYPVDHESIRNPLSIQKVGWNKFKSVYLDKQDVQLDLKRFRDTLLKALELLHQ